MYYQDANSVPVICHAFQMQTTLTFPKDQFQVAHLLHVVVAKMQVIEVKLSLAFRPITCKIDQS